MRAPQNQTPPGQSKLMHYGMMTCCAVMLVSVAGFFLAGGTVAGHSGNAGVFAPLALCLGAHFLMFKVMGKPCHGAADDRSQPAVATFRDAASVSSPDLQRH